MQGNDIVAQPLGGGEMQCRAGNDRSFAWFALLVDSGICQSLANGNSLAAIAATMLFKAGGYRVY